MKKQKIPQPMPSKIYAGELEIMKLNDKMHGRYPMTKEVFKKEAEKLDGTVIVYIDDQPINLKYWALIIGDTYDNDEDRYRYYVENIKHYIP